MSGRAPLPAVFARNGLVISIIAALSVAAFILGFAAYHDGRILFGVHSGPGAFSKLMPHNAMAALFGAVFLYAIVALLMGVRAFWRDIGKRSAGRADAGSIWQAICDAGELRYLDGGGVGCFNEDDRTTDRRKIYHHLTFYGFGAVLRGDLCGDALSLSVQRARRPTPWWDLPVVLGTLGGVGLLIKTIGLLGEEWEARSRAGRCNACRHGHRLHRHAVPDQPDRHGAIAVARDAGDGAAIGAAYSAWCSRCSSPCPMANSCMGFYRFVALVRYARGGG